MKKRREIFYSVLGCDQPIEVDDNAPDDEPNLKDDDLYIGDARPIDYPQAVIEIMELRHRLVNESIALCESEGDEEAKKVAERNQFETYAQFRRYYDIPDKQEKEVEKEKLYKHGLQKYTTTKEYVPKEIQTSNGTINRNDLKRDFDCSPQGYVKFLLKSDLKIKSFFLSRLPYLIPQRARLKHTVAYAATGYGKSELIKFQIYADIKKAGKCSVVLIDPHGDLAKEVAQLKLTQKHKDKIVYICPSLKYGMLPCFNPLEMNDNSEKNITRYLDYLIDSIQLVMGQDWATRMRTLLTYCLPVLLREGGKDIRDLIRFMDYGKNRDNDDLVELAIKNNPYPDHAEWFRKDFLRDDLDTTKRAIRDRLAIVMGDPTFAYMITHKTFDLESLINEGNIIIFNLSKGQLGKRIPINFGIFLTGMMYFYAVKRDDLPKNMRKPTYVYIDEFHMFLRTDSTEEFENLLKETRKYKVALNLSSQDEIKLSPDLKHIIRTNAGVQIRGGERKKDSEYKDYGIGEFEIDIQNRKPAKILVPNSLVYDDYPSEYIKKEEYEEFKKEQIAKFYIPVEYKDRTNEHEEIKQSKNLKRSQIDKIVIKDEEPDI